MRMSKIQCGLPFAYDTLALPYTNLPNLEAFVIDTTHWHTLPPQSYQLLQCHEDTLTDPNRCLDVVP